MKNLNKIILACMLSLFGFANLQSQDWADLNRFKDDNAKLPAVQENEKRILFMGNSITIGWSSNVGEI